MFAILSLVLSASQPSITVPEQVIVSKPAPGSLVCRTPARELIQGSGTVKVCEVVQ